MVLKINIPDKTGKTYKVELETEAFNGKSLHDKISGKEILPDLADYEFEIAGASDKSGFTVMKGVPGIGLKKVLLTYGKAMKNRPKYENKKKRTDTTPKGLKLRKTVRGEVISEAISQINLRVTKKGEKPLAEIFSSGKAEEAKAEENKTEAKKESEKSVEEAPKQEAKIEEKKE